MVHARKDYNKKKLDSFIPKDEPVFLLRASDKYAPRVIKYWAEKVESNGGQKQMADDARKHADKMEAYGKSKMPDQPE